jgi:hypothetical protein
MSRVILNKFAKYVELTNSENKVLIDYLLSSVGVCFGSSVCHGVMDVIGKLNWWEAALVEIARWDGDRGTLQKIVELPGQNEDATLGRIINRALNYILISHMVNADYFAPYYIGSNSKIRHALKLTNSQFYSLRAGGPFEIVDGDKLKKIQASKTFMAGLEDLQLRKVLTEISKNICVVSNGNHAIRVGYNEVTHEWILYNPNYDHYSKKLIHQVFHSYEELTKEIKSILVSDNKLKRSVQSILELDELRFTIASFDENKIPCSKYEDVRVRTIKKAVALLVGAVVIIAAIIMLNPFLLGTLSSLFALSIFFVFTFTVHIIFQKTAFFMVTQLINYQVIKQQLRRRKRLQVLKKILR